MFICSLRAGTLRFFGVIALALAVLVTLIAFVPALSPVRATAAEPAEAHDFEKAGTNEERVAFLASFGYQVQPEPTESEKVTVPRNFDKVFAAYNELQKKQGLDLAPYAGKTVERYTYTVLNYPDYDGVVYANLLVYRGRVIGGDVCAADANGFLHGFEK